MTSVVGGKFNRWTIVSEPYSRCKGGALYVDCVCECGTQRAVLLGSIRRSASKSCGCLKKEIARNLFTKHSKIDTKEYYAWKSMKQRCSNPKSKAYKDYGGRGITYDPRWESFENFYADMGERPEGTTLDRIDVNGNYCKENCRWSAWSEQMHNKRKQKRGGESSSDFIGVYYSKITSDWEACLVKDGVTMLRKRFPNEIQAAIAYDQQSLICYGDEPNKELLKEYLDG